MLFLDEPTIGSSIAKAVIRELLRAESEREGVTLLLTSHDTGDMERVCTRVIVNHHGRLCGTVPIPACAAATDGKAVDGMERRGTFESRDARGCGWCRRADTARTGHRARHHALGSRRGRRVTAG
jgi:ABC-type multidrug transport system ATPase subunit